LKRIVKLLLGVATVLPTGLVFSLLGPGLGRPATMFKDNPSQAERDAVGQWLVSSAGQTYFFILVVAIGAVGAIYYYYLWHASQLRNAKDRHRWRTALLLGNIITMPIYWYVKIWRDPSA